jgi:hypothetical protein
MKRTRLIRKMSTTAFSNMCAIINANEGQTPALQPREPTVHPDSGMPEDQRTEAAVQHRQVPVTRKKMPEHQKAEATSQPRRMNEGPKRASVTVSGERRGGMPKYGQALTARNSREETGLQRKRHKQDGPRQHISSQPTQPSRKKKKGPDRASLTGKGEVGEAATGQPRGAGSNRPETAGRRPVVSSNAPSGTALPRGRRCQSPRRQWFQPSPGGRMRVPSGPA